MSESLFIPCGHQRTDAEADDDQKSRKNSNNLHKEHLVNESSFSCFEDAIEGCLRCAAKLSEAGREHYLPDG